VTHIIIYRQIALIIMYFPNIKLRVCSNHKNYYSNNIFIVNSTFCEPPCREFINAELIIAELIIADEGQ